MIPTNVWDAWKDILDNVVLLITSNVITMFVVGTMMVEIVANLIYRIATSKQGDE